MWVSVGVGMSVAQSLDLVLWCMSYLTAAVDVGSGQGGIRRLGVSAAAASTSSRPFDLVIMDIQMRQVNGDEVCRQLVASGFGIPVIAMTGLSCGAVASGGLDGRGRGGRADGVQTTVSPLLHVSFSVHVLRFGRVVFPVLSAC